MGEHWTRTSRAPTPTEEEDIFYQAMGVLDVLKDRVRLSGMPPGLTAEMRRVARVPAPMRHGRTPVAAAAGPGAPASPAAPAGTKPGGKSAPS
jgi:hypothetical protein